MGVKMFTKFVRFLIKMRSISTGHCNDDDSGAGGHCS